MKILIGKTSFRISKIPLIISSLLIFSNNLTAKYDPDLTWKTIKTEHFYFHYHQGQEILAEKVAALAERKYPLMIKKLGHEPYFRTHVVLSDIVDSPNGMTTLEPWNRIEMFSAKPLLGNQLSNYRDWDDLLFTHEYTHVLNLDPIHGLPALSRYILGRVWFPNTNQPFWIIEGSAVAEESAEGFGRNHSSFVEMVFRTAAASDTLKSINRSSNSIRDWPAENIYYLYGGRFIAWLKKKYPDKNFHDIHIENSDNVWPYMNNTNSVDVFGRKFTDLWDEWLDELKIEQAARIQQIQQLGITQLVHLTDPDFYQIFPRFDTGGKNIFYLNQNNYQRSTLRKIRLEEKRGSQKVRELNSPEFLTLGGDEPFVLDAEVYKNFSIYNDIFLGKQNKQITSKLRAVSLDFMPSGEMIAITQNAGEFTLGLYNPQGERLKLLFGPTTATIAHARVASDGKKIVFSMKERTSAATHLYLFSIQNGDLEQLTDGNFVDIHPVWSRDGKKIAFSSDRSGVYNIYELEMARREMVRLSNVTGGLFYPDYAPDGNKIVVSEFGEKGYGIAILDRSPIVLDRQKLVYKKLDALTFINPTASTKDSEAKEYSVFPSILPSSWAPLLMYNSSNSLMNGVGASVWGVDALRRDFWELSYFQGIDRSVPTYGALDVTYENRRFWPDFYFAPSATFGKDCQVACAAYISTGMVFPFSKYYTRHAIYANASVDYMNSIFGFTENTWSTGMLGYSFRNTQYFSRSVSPENGRAWGISAKYLNLSYPSFQYSGHFANLGTSYTEYLPAFFRNNVLMARVFWGQSINLGWGGFQYREASQFSHTYEAGYQIRGYSRGNWGTGLYVSSLEYRFPIYQPDWGFFRVPVFFRDFYGKFFADAGQSYNSSVEFSRIKTSAGAEIGLSSIFGFKYYWTAYVGYARGFNENGEHQVYFGILGYTGVITAKYSPHAEYR